MDLFTKNDVCDQLKPDCNGPRRRRFLYEAIWIVCIAVASSAICVLIDSVQSYNLKNRFMEGDKNVRITRFVLKSGKYQINVDNEQLMNIINENMEFKQGKPGMCYIKCEIWLNEHNCGEAKIGFGGGPYGFNIEMPESFLSYYFEDQYCYRNIHIYKKSEERDAFCDLLSSLEMLRLN